MAAHLAILTEYCISVFVSGSADIVAMGDRYPQQLSGASAYAWRIFFPLFFILCCPEWVNLSVQIKLHLGNSQPTTILLPLHTKFHPRPATLPCVNDELPPEPTTRTTLPLTVLLTAFVLSKGHSKQMRRPSASWLPFWSLEQFLNRYKCQIFSVTPMNI